MDHQGAWECQFPREQALCHLTLQGERILEKIRTEAVNPFMNLVGHVQSG